MVKMKVAYMLGSVNRGGTETLMLDVFRNAKKAPFEMIGIHRKGGAYLDDFYAAGPKMIQCAPKRFGYLRYLIRLHRILQSEDIRVVHTQQWLDCVYAWLATIGMPIRIVTTFHGFRSLKGLSGLLHRMSIRMADEVCFVSRYEEAWYRRQMRINEAKCHVVYNGIDFSKIESASPTEIDTQSAKRIRLGMVGNFVDGRSQHIIVKAIHQLKKRGITDFDFYFIGRRVDDEAWRYDECVQYAETNKLTNIHFLGGRSDVPSLLKSLDGFVYSTEHDTFGIAVVEAVSAGLPVVINDWPVMKEVCDSALPDAHQAIRFFHTDDVPDCADTMEELLSDLAVNRPQLVAACESVAKEIKKKYSVEAHIRSLYSVYTGEHVHLPEAR